jgi:hypothetical protein
MAREDEDERDMRKIAVYDDEALKLMQGWTGGETDPLYAISSTGGWNYAWVFTDAIYNIDRDLRSVKKLGRNKFQLGKGTFTKAEIDELRYIRDALQMALDDPESELVDEAREGRVEAPRKPADRRPRRHRARTPTMLHASSQDVSDKVDVNELAKMFDLPDYDKIDEQNVDYVWENGDYAYKEALGGGASEDEAEEARQKAEGEAQTEIYNKWHSGVIDAAEALFGEHGLTLVPIKPKHRGSLPYTYKVVPTTSWNDALKQIIETINGVGYFHFSNPKEFLDSGPYASARIGVLTHLHHIKDQPAVYGGTSAQSIFDRAWR